MFPTAPDKAATRVGARHISQGRGALMEAEQIAFPFRPVSRKIISRGLNTDLIGRSFADGAATISVIGVCPGNPRHVMVQRDLDGKSWSVPAGMIRLITGHRKRRAA